MFGLFKTKSLDEQIALRTLIVQRAAMTYVATGSPVSLEGFKCCFEAIRRRAEAQNQIYTALDKNIETENLSQIQMSRNDEILDFMAFGFETFDLRKAFSNLQRSSPLIFKAIRKCDVDLAEKGFLS